MTIIRLFDSVTMSLLATPQHMVDATLDQHTTTSESASKIIKDTGGSENTEITYMGTDLLSDAAKVESFSIKVAGNLFAETTSIPDGQNNILNSLNTGIFTPDLLAGNDEIYGSEFSDVITGYRGADVMSAGNGDDEVRAGNGSDLITGGSGGDLIYGGFGHNTFTGERDGSVDSIFFKSDQFAYNWIYDSAGNSPNGEKVDVIKALDSSDELYVQGVETSMLSFGSVDNFSTQSGDFSGIGIYANGFLEAIYTGGDLNTQQLQSMTSGVAA